MLSVEVLLTLCWLLVIVIIVTIQHFPAIIPCLLLYDNPAVMIIGNKKIFLVILPVSLLALITFIWRHRRRYYWQAPLPPTSRSIRRNDNNVTEELSIASEFIGFVIGRQGNKVKELEKQTSTIIRFREAKDGKVVMVTGQRSNVERAKEAIVIMVKEKSEKQVKSVDVIVPHFAIGRLIGKHGQNIGAMQKESGARVTVDNNRGSNIRACTISGTSEQVSRAVAMVQQSIAESEAAQQRNKLNMKLKTDNVQMKTAQRQSYSKSGQKELPSQRSLPMKPCNLPSNSEYFPAFVSNVSTVGHVWIQPLNATSSVLDDLTNAMMNCYSNMSDVEHKLINPSIGNYCAAKFSNDGQWYRAQVISTNPTTAHLLFIDYGDDEWHPIGELKILLPQFCKTPIQACECQIGGVAISKDKWNKEAIELLEDVTLCAKWEPVMVKVTDHTSHPTRVTIVNTSSDKDVDVATKINDFVTQLPQQQEPLDETVIMEMSPTQLESSVNVFDDMDKLVNDHSSNQDDPKHSKNGLEQTGCQDDQEINDQDDQINDQDDQQCNDKLEQVDETVVMEMSPTQLESSINTFDEGLQQLDDHNNDQDGKNPQNAIDQQSDQDDMTSNQNYEVQGVSMTFDSDSDDDIVTLQVEEDVNESWLHSGTESVTVTTTTVKHTPNCVTITPVL